jgi:hypothetical protein
MWRSALLEASEADTGLQFGAELDIARGLRGRNREGVELNGFWAVNLWMGHPSLALTG